VKFYKFLETAKANLVHTNGKQTKFSKEFYGDVSSIVPFVFVPRDEIQTIDARLHDETLDLPFKSCFFEMLGAPITEINEQGAVATIDGILIHEMSPKTYNMMLLMCEVPVLSPRSAPRRYTIYAMDSRNMGKLSVHIVGIVRNLLEQLTHQETGVINPRHSVKMKVNGQKLTHRINKIVYVSPKSQRHVAQAHASKEIDWSHRFEVRGHWRKVDTIGKDREGLYCVEGFTWVKEHVRGPEHLPVIKKTRVVQPSTTS